MEFKTLVHKIHKNEFGVIRNGCLWTEYSQPQLFHKDTDIESIQKSVIDVSIDKLKNFELKSITLTFSTEFNDIKTGHTYLKNIFEQVEEHGKIELNKDNYWWEPIVKLFKK